MFERLKKYLKSARKYLTVKNAIAIVLALSGHAEAMGLEAKWFEIAIEVLKVLGLFA